MKNDNINYIPVGRVKPRRRNWIRTCLDVCCDVIGLLASMAAIVLAAILAGAGFGWGMALISIWP